MNIQAMRIINNYETYIRRSLKGTASLYSMDIFEFGRVFGGGEASVLKYFQDHHLIRSGVECVPCGRPFSTIKKTGSVVGYRLRPIPVSGIGYRPILLVSVSYRYR